MWLFNILFVCMLCIPPCNNVQHNGISLTVASTAFLSCVRDRHLAVLNVQAGQDYLTSINSAAVAPAALTISRVDPLQQGDLVNSTMTKAARGL